MSDLVQRLLKTATEGLGSGSPLSSEIPGATKNRASTTGRVFAPTTGSRTALRPAAPMRPPTPPATPAAPSPTSGLRSFAPALMQAVAPIIGSIGGAPGLMAAWDVMSNGGNNLRTIFGGGGTTPTPSAPPSAPAPPSTPAAPAPAPAPPTPPAPTPAPAPPAPATPAPPAPPAAPTAPPPPAPAPGGSWYNPPAPRAAPAPSAPGGSWYNPPAPRAAPAPSAPAPGGSWYNPPAPRAAPAPTSPASPNAAESYRQTVDNLVPDVTVRGTTVNPGSMAHDMGGMALLGKGLSHLSRGAIGMGHPAVSFGLDGLDLLGANPLGGRFGQGVVSGEEFRQGGRGMADLPPELLALTGGTQPLTTIGRGVASVGDAASELGRATSSTDRAIQRDRQQSLTTGQAPSLTPTGGPARSVGAVARRVAGSVGVPRSQPQAFVNATRTFADEATNAATNFHEAAGRSDAWREWAAREQQRLQAQVTTSPPGQGGRAQADLNSLQSQREIMRSTVPENLYRNVTSRSVVNPFSRDFWRGNWHAPWSSDVD